MSEDTRTAEQLMERPTEREALIALVDALEHERPRYASESVRFALGIARDALCVCAETSTRNCPIHGNA